MMISALRTIVAHQGGWDEAALFVIPVVVALVAVKLVERRQRRKPSPGDRDGPDDVSAHEDAD